jgi:hypothetical protein
VIEHLDPDPEMHTTRELLEHIHALLAQIGEMHNDTGRLRAELDALRSEADQVATVGLTWKREAERLGTIVPRIEALTRWLLDEGHITPMGVRQLQAVLADQEAT